MYVQHPLCFVIVKGIQCGVFNICVVKKYRKQEELQLGTLMTQLVISEAQQMGCQQMILQASPLGRPVYERMGFLHMVDEFAGDFAGGAESILTKINGQHQSPRSLINCLACLSEASSKHRWRCSPRTLKSGSCSTRRKER